MGFKALGSRGPAQHRPRFQRPPWADHERGRVGGARPGIATSAPSRGGGCGGPNFVPFDAEKTRASSALRLSTWMRSSSFSRSRWLQRARSESTSSNRASLSVGGGWRAQVESERGRGVCVTWGGRRIQCACGEEDVFRPQAKLRSPRPPPCPSYGGLAHTAATPTATRFSLMSRRTVSVCFSPSPRRNATCISSSRTSSPLRRSSSEPTSWDG